MDAYKAWLADVLDKNKRMFQIPVYQRNYDWSNVQCEKLFEDIISAEQNEKNILFEASILLLKYA